MLKHILLMMAISHAQSDSKMEPCNLNDLPDALSAFNRATSETCKNLITSVACDSKNRLSKFNLDRKCPNVTIVNLGYIPFKDFQSYLDSKVITINKMKSLETCSSACLTDYQYEYAFFHDQTSHCYCLGVLTKQIQDEINQSESSHKNSLIISRTKILKFPKVSPLVQNSIKKPKLPRIVFLFTVNGRSIRQILRLLKAVYSDSHYYYFHVDERAIYLKNELSKINWLKNYRVASWSMPTIWGGASLLQMHLKVMQELIDLKTNDEWNWDFVLNLSESDYPIKSMKELTAFLAKNSDKNFLKFKTVAHTKWLKSSGIQHSFVQCDNHMWRVGGRDLPQGLQIEGGSDWFCLNYEFIHYLLNSKEEFLEYLKEFFSNTLLPSERSQGCQCQYKNIVDWCGCSPNLMTYEDWPTLLQLASKPIFFARKFDPIFNSQLINNVDQSIHGLYSPSFQSLNSFWLNVFHKPEDHIKKNNFEMLFDYFLLASSELLVEHLSCYENYHIQYKAIQSVYNNYLTNSNRLEDVIKANAYFQSDKFQGYIINVRAFDNTTNTFVDYEAFFKPTKKKEITKINEKNAPNAHIFLESLAKFEISTDYDFKEQMFLTNYASIIHQDSNPILHMILDPVTEPLNMTIEWTNSENQVVKESLVTLPAQNSSQLILNGFFGVETKIKKLKLDPVLHNLNVTGVWKIDIKLSGSESVLTRQFLVLPRINVFDNDFWKNMLRNFWYIHSVCFNNESQLDTHEWTELFLGSCNKSAYWSSYYPDPKSEFKLRQKTINSSERIS